MIDCPVTVAGINMGKYGYWILQRGSGVWRNEHLTRKPAVICKHGIPRYKCKECTRQYSRERYRQRRVEQLKLSKKCTRCGQTLPLTQFYKSNKNGDGRKYWCKECTLKQKRERLARKRHVPAGEIMKQHVGIKRYFFNKCVKCNQRFLAHKKEYYCSNCDNTVKFIMLLKEPRPVLSDRERERLEIKREYAI